VSEYKTDKHREDIISEQARDYYEILGVSRSADQKAIKDAFRRLALRYHPDRNKEPEAEERFKEIAEAYAVLSDPRKRAQYDAGGLAGVAGYSPEDLFGGIDFQDLFGGFDLGFDFGGGLFDRFFRHRRGPEQGANLEMRLTVPLERVASGGEERIRVSRPATCPSCHGSGAAAGTAPRVCPACNGSGQKSKTRRERDGAVLIRQITACPVCHGQGRLIDKPCRECGGSGRVEREEALTVNVPVGAEEGMALRIPGHGLPSHDPGGAAGDLYVVLHTAPDSRFQRAGADLWRTETVSMADAALGTEITVPTLDRPATVEIPAGVQPDQVLRLQDKGLPEFGGKGRGDLYVRLRVAVPQRLSHEERSLYRRLQEIERGRK
jgi:molecular chaperone DnaJ